MKKSLILLSFGAVTISLFASVIFPYNNAKPPGISLPDAYGRAVNTLGSATNQFHCLNANVTTDFGPDGGWQFTFYSTNSKPKWVTVEFNGRIHVEDIIIR